MANGDLVTKEYIDNGKRNKFYLSTRKPTNPSIGDIWYQLPAVQYTWADVNELNYTFADVDAQNLTWADADMGGW